MKIEKNKCISCLACAFACPKDNVDIEGLFVEIIDPRVCSKCDEPCKSVCPTKAISK